MRLMTGKLCIILFMAVLPVPACAEYTADELLRMTMEAVSYDKLSDTARVRGVGKIARDDGMGKVLARRAAVVDAQRAFLILRRGIKEGKPFRADSVSGHVPPFRIVSEDIRDGVYFVYAETSLSELMKAREVRRTFVLPDYDEDDNDDEEDEEGIYDENSKDHSIPAADSLNVR